MSPDLNSRSQPCNESFQEEGKTNAKALRWQYREAQGQNKCMIEGENVMRPEKWAEPLAWGRELEFFF